MSSQVNIERAVVNDIRFIAESQVAMAYETEAMALSLDVVLAGVQHIFDEPDRGFYVLARTIDDNAPIACMLVLNEWSDWRNCDVWWLHSVYVVPAFRGEGVFRKMFKFIETMAVDQQIRGIRLYVEKSNARAQAVYRALGMSDKHYDLFEKMIST
ncbi:GNAT family N-acetyltransferase [candidate division KSB1 bacterium]|nr:GNAT family N-acetyltransferase [candidate division KSB1 bacterium]